MKFISQKQAASILKVALGTGADFAEIFFEHTVANAIEMVSGEVTKNQTNIIHGASVRILLGAQEVFGYLNDWSAQSLKELAKKLRASIKSPIKVAAKEFVPQPERHVIEPKKLPTKVKNSAKIALMTKTFKAAKATSKEVSQVVCTLSDKEQNVLIVNSNGTFVTDLRTNTRLACTVVAGSGANMQAISDSIGDNKGYELFEEHDIKEFAKDIAKSAVTMASADEMVGGKMTVVVHNGFGGVLLHEACVHSLEATSVAKGASVFCNKLGQKIASDVVTAIDEGDRPGQWGSMNFDDEGHPTQKNVLIENGILKSYLVDYRNSRIMNHPVTGSGRRQSYQLSPTSRMSNTFFAPGKDKFEDIIANTKFGLFAKRMGGGSVNPSTGEFNFAVNEGYMIEDGKITKPVRGATLVGSGSEILMNIDMISDNLAFGHGMCGSQSGSIPTDVGEPTIRVQNVTVGGRGVK